MNTLTIPALPTTTKPSRKKVCLSLDEALLSQFDKALNNTNLDRSHAVDFLMQTFISQQPDLVN